MSPDTRETIRLQFEAYRKGIRGTWVPILKLLNFAIDSEQMLDMVPDFVRRLLTLLENLGFHPVATVRKRRESFHLTFHEHELEIALDTAEGLGPFAEIEALASSEADLPAAQQDVLTLAGTLGLTEVEPRSYLRMVLENQAAAPG